MSNEEPKIRSIVAQLVENKRLEIAMQYGGNSKQLLKEVRRNCLPCQLTVDSGGDDRPVIE